MRKLQLLLGLMIGMLSLSKAQPTKEKPLLKAFYLFEHITDTLNPEVPHKENMVLFVGANSSLYGSYESELMIKSVSDQFKSSSFDGNLVLRSSGSAASETYYFYFPKELAQSIHTIRGKAYLVEEKFPKIDWEILPETKEIKGFSCQAAKGKWGGRVYTAWFTTDLPLKGGPWKLQGLPGLILEAKDDANQVSFTLDQMETLQDHPQHIATDPILIPATHKELARLREALNKQMSTNSAAGGSMVVQGTAAPTARGSKDILSLGGGYTAGLDESIDPNRIQSIRVERVSAGTAKQINNPLEKTNP